MLINSEKLIGLKVETQNGTYLGRVQSFDIDIDTQGIRSYHIKPTVFESRLFFHSEGFIVHNKQVVSINEEKMVVLDNVVKYKEENKVLVGAGAEIG